MRTDGECRTTEIWESRVRMRILIGVLLIALIIAVPCALVYLVVSLNHRRYDKWRTPYERWMAVDDPPERALETWRTQHDPLLSQRGFYLFTSSGDGVRYRRRSISGYMVGIAILLFPLGALAAFLFGRDSDIVTVEVEPRDVGALIHLSGEIGPNAHHLLRDLPGSESSPQSGLSVRTDGA